jgi:hypothetical protein
MNSTKLENTEIRWHPTTPTHFRCEPDCVCCCARPFFFTSEKAKLPPNVKEKLTYKYRRRLPEEAISLSQKNAGHPRRMIVPKPLIPYKGRTCGFFNPESPCHCTVHSYRPLRCKLFPFLPLLVKNKIVIFAEPFLTLFRTEDEPDWFRCFGLGKGKNVQASINEMSRKFLMKLAEEYPILFRDYCVDDTDQLIDWKEIEKFRKPKYNSWKEAKPVVYQKIEKKLRGYCGESHPR